MTLINALTRWLPDPVAGRSSMPSLPRRAGKRPQSGDPVEIIRDAYSRIVHVRIGRWRVLAANETRRIAEVHQLACGRVAIRIESDDPQQRQPSRTIWELYHITGHLLAMLQATHDQQRWLPTEFATAAAAADATEDSMSLSA